MRLGPNEVILEKGAYLREDGKVVFRMVIRELQLVRTRESAAYELADFRKMYPDVEIQNLPDDPAPDPNDIAVNALPKYLADVADEGVIKRMMKKDGRSTAAKHYIKRLEDLGDDAGDAGSTGGESGEAG